MFQSSQVNFKNLNAVASLEASEFINLLSLPLSTKIRGTNFKLIKTRYGDRIIATLQLPEGEKNAFFPARVQFNSEELEDLNSSPVYVEITGQKTVKGRSTPLIKFSRN